MPGPRNHTSHRARWLRITRSYQQVLNHRWKKEERKHLKSRRQLNEQQFGFPGQYFDSILLSGQLLLLLSMSPWSHDNQLYHFARWEVKSKGWLQQISISCDQVCASIHLDFCPLLGASQCFCISSWSLIILAIPFSEVWVKKNKKKNEMLCGPRYVWRLKKLDWPYMTKAQYQNPNNACRKKKKKCSRKNCVTQVLSLNSWRKKVEVFPFQFFTK